MRTVKGVIRKLEELLPELVNGDEMAEVYYTRCSLEILLNDGDRLGVYKIISWRGSYREVSFDTGEPQGYQAMDVYEFYNSLLSAANGAVLEGYKGGLFKMNEDCEVYLDARGDYNNFYIKDIIVVNGVVTIIRGED